MSEIRYILYITATLDGKPIKGSVPKDWNQKDGLVLQDNDLYDTRLLQSRLECKELFKGIQSIENNPYELISWEAFRVKVFEDGRIAFAPEPEGYYCAPYIPTFEVE